MSQMSIHNRTKLEVEANWQFRGSKFANFYDNYNYPPKKVSLTTLKSNVRGEAWHTLRYPAKTSCVKYTFPAKLDSDDMLAYSTVTKYYKPERVTHVAPGFRVRRKAIF